MVDGGREEGADDPLGAVSGVDIACKPVVADLDKVSDRGGWLWLPV